MLLQTVAPDDGLVCFQLQNCGFLRSHIGLAIGRSGMFRWHADFSAILWQMKAFPPAQPSRRPRRRRGLQQLTVSILAMGWVASPTSTWEATSITEQKPRQARCKMRHHSATRARYIRPVSQRPLLLMVATSTFRFWPGSLVANTWDGELLTKSRRSNVVLSKTAQEEQKSDLLRGRIPCYII